MVPVRANDQPAWGEYVCDPITGRLHVVGVVVIGLAPTGSTRSPILRRRSRRTSACPGRSTRRFALEQVVRRRERLVCWPCPGEPVDGQRGGGPPHRVGEDGTRGIGCVEDGGGAAEHRFPIVGRAPGRFLEHAARAVGARRGRELGSGYGYSAYWFARAVGPGGEVVAPTATPENARLAEDYLSAAGMWDRVRYRIGIRSTSSRRIRETSTCLLGDGGCTRIKRRIGGTSERPRAGGKTSQALESTRVYDEMLFTVEAGQATPVGRRDLASLEMQERAHLQEWILANPDVIGPGVKIITSEYDRWQTASGTPVLDRLDVLGIDAEGRLVVVELKRDIAPHTVHMQAINYAAMVSRLAADDVADLYAATQTRSGVTMDREAASTALETELLLSAEGIRHPRVVLIASDFPPSVTASVVWLNEQKVDISLIRFRVYVVGDRTVVSFNRLFPVPDVEEFTIGRRLEQPTKVAAGEPGDPWDEEALRKLAAVANQATLSMIDLCAVEGADPIAVKDIASAAGVTEQSVRGQLAGLSIRLRNPRSGFAQTAWPVKVAYGPGGMATYKMETELAAIWRQIRHDLGGVSSVVADSAGTELVDPVSSS
jgi:hypothetical protein